MYFQLGCRNVVNKDERAVAQTLNCQSVLVHKSFVHTSGWGKRLCLCLWARLPPERLHQGKNDVKLKCIWGQNYFLYSHSLHALLSLHPCFSLLGVLVSKAQICRDLLHPSLFRTQILILLQSKGSRISVWNQMHVQDSTLALLKDAKIHVRPTGCQVVQIIQQF